VVAAAVAVVAVDDDWWQKWPAMRALMVTGHGAMKKADSGKQRNNQPAVFHANNLLITKFPQPTSCISNTLYHR
jgi:hypothetical protein